MSRVIDALVQRLVDTNVAVAGTTVFAGSDTDLPSSLSGPPFLSLHETGGTLTRFHNVKGLANPSFQVVSRGDLYQTVADLADAALLALGGDPALVNVTISGIYFLDIHPTSPPLQLPLDAQGRVRLAFNVATSRRL